MTFVLCLGAIGTVPSAVLAAPVGAGFDLNAGDMRFILKQIKIAENHATQEGPGGAAIPPAADGSDDLVGPGQYQIANALLPFGLRTVDGSENNLLNALGRSTFGASKQAFPRLTTPVYRAAENVPPGFGPPGPPVPTSYNQTSGMVFDSQPRLISNLIVDQTDTNPAAVRAAFEAHRAAFGDSVSPCTSPGVPANCIPSGETLPIPNVTTDFGLSPPYNSFFTIFGQFFDHGLDLTAKGGAGTVFVPLKDDDPLVLGPDGLFGTPDDLNPNLRFMVLTRATNLPGVPGHEAMNLDSSWVDQSQTYTSHPTHQVFLRAYTQNASGDPIATGALIEGDPAGPAVGGMATWANVKAQAASLLGIQLVDADAVRIPMVLTDQYGRFLRGPNGFPQLVTGLGPDGQPNTFDDVRVEGDPNAQGGLGISTTNAVRIGIAFLDDIAHNAAPNAGLVRDGDGVITNPAAQPTGTYDGEMLDSHFIAGDGRVNENIALTAIHQVFHSEHNRLVEYMKGLLVSLNLDLAEWRPGGPGANVPNDGWNGERLFQAARFVTEMEYQHLVFEEFARKMQPAINAFNPFTQSDTGINPAIMAEFAHAVYRFGHSMLNETIARTSTVGQPNNDISLLDGFLNPAAYYEDGDGNPATSLTPAEAAGTIAMGMSDQVANELDEFVADTLRNNLLGLPLDLPTLNITRARDTGIPSLNNVRRQIWTATNDASLAPYQSWVDFGLGLKHQYSVVNYMAAYGTHPTITGQTTILGKRAAAQLIFDNGAGAPADSAAFVHSTGAWANTGTTNITGVDGIDLWVGGLAESQPLFGGLLGSTFNYVFERQMTDLQDGDRLYYLSRTSGLNLRTALESNSFAELVQRNTSAEALKADPFGTADCEFVLANLPPVGAPFTTDIVPNDPTTECDESVVLIRMPDGTIRYRQTNAADPPGINAQNTFNGTDAVNRVWGGVDNDTFWGGLGNDVFEGSDGGDVALGGEGDDIMTDSAGDDIFKGGPGNDAMDLGPGIDVPMGGPGQDFINGGLNDNATFAGEDNDFIISGGGPDQVFGGGGDDWQEGGNGNDLLQGDSGAPFFDDINDAGSDVLIGGSNEDDYDAEGGNDIMVAGDGIERNHGARGFDWTVHARSPIPGDSDLTVLLVENPALRDRFLDTEALSGWNLNDVLRGNSVVPFDAGAEINSPFGVNALTPAGMAEVNGLLALVGAGNIECQDALATPITTDGTCGFGKGNILLGGGGSDLLEGRGADDIIDGDAWLNVRLTAVDQENQTRTFNGLNEMIADVFTNHGTPNHINPGNISIVREILYAPAGTDTDVVVFTGPRADYDIEGLDFNSNNDGWVTVMDTTSAPFVPGVLPVGDGTDVLRNVERLDFADTSYLFTGNAFVVDPAPSIGSVFVSNAAPAENQVLTANPGFSDPNGIDATTIVYTWEAETAPGSGNWANVGTGPTFTPNDSVVGRALQVQATFEDLSGIPDSKSTLQPTAPVTNVNDIPAGFATVNDATPQVFGPLTADISSIADEDGLPASLGIQWQHEVGSAWVNISGATTATYSPTVDIAGHRLRVVVSYTDLHGTAEQRISTPTAVVTDLAVKTLALSAASNSGAAGDLVTNDNTPTFTGTATPNRTIQLLAGGPVVVATGTTSASGTFELTSSPLADGDQVVSVWVIDDLNNISPALSVGTVRIDTVAPTATIDAGPAAVSASRSGSHDFSSNDSPSSFECALTVNGGVQQFAACTSPQPFTSLSNGSYTFALRATDAAGNVSPVATRAFTINSSFVSTVVPGPTRTLNAIADAQVQSNRRTANFGRLATIRTRQGASGANYRSYLKFNVTGITGAVTSVKLRLYVTNRSLNVHRIYKTVRTNWTETAIRWSNAPTITGRPVLARIAPRTVRRYVEFTLPKSTITRNGVVSFVIVGGGADLAVFQSRTGINKPKLVITQGP